MSVFFLFCSVVANAQLNEGGMPASSTMKKDIGSFQHVVLQAPGIEELMQEDAEDQDGFRGERFAKLVPVNLNPLSSGTWQDLRNGQKIWRLKLSLEGSLASSLYFTDFNLPEDVSLFIYDEGGGSVKGAYTDRNNRENGLFASELIYSGTVVLELNIPADLQPGKWFTIAEITFVYDAYQLPDGSKGFGDSQFCEVNINCQPEGDNWQDEKKGVVRIQVKVSSSIYWCSGSMINNVRQDKTPYLLTADHCAYKFGVYATEQDLGSWIFYFNYESAGCADPQFEPQLFSLTGCEKIANEGTHGMEGSDFYLVKLLDIIPSSYPVYFNGWSTVDAPSSSGVTIHHPNGDIKKVSTYDEPLVSSSWQGNGLPSHWKVLWVQTQNNWGVTEGGSSGAPLFDNLGRMVGTLTGGLASCSSPELPDYYGKFSYHWDSNGLADTLQLKPWLDPDNTGAIALSGLMMGENEIEFGKGEQLKIFPNPVGNELNVDYSQQVRHAFRVEILDMFGNTILHEQVDNPVGTISLQVGHLGPGIYFLRMSGEDSTVVRKIIKR